MITSSKKLLSLLLLVSAFVFLQAACFMPQVHAATIQIPATGQTGCWDTSGAAVPCSGTGQDGDKLAGAAWPNPRFSDNGDQTMTDNLTGLIWTKDGNPAAAVKTWQEALDYVASLNSANHLGYSDWRLPNRKELMSLVNRQLANSATWLTAQGFNNVQARNYWSSSSYLGTGYAWGVYMDDGIVYSGRKTDINDVWPVRGGQSGSLGSLTISTVSPTTATVNVAQNYTVSGTELPVSIVGNIEGSPSNCTYVSGVGASVVLNCTATVVGHKRFYLAATSGGAAISGSENIYVDVADAGASLFSVAPTSATQGALTTFTVTGSNLPGTIALTLENANCGSPYSISSTSAKVDCTPQQTGSKLLYVAITPGGAAISGSPFTVVVSDPVAKASGIAPATATRGVLTAFTVAGSNLPGTITMSLADANCGSPYSITSTSAKISCTPQVSGTKSFYVVHTAGGTAINGSPFTVFVADPSNQPMLIIQKSGAGSGTVTSVSAGINCGATCSAAFSDKTAVTLTAAAANGSTFLGWSGGGCSGTGSCTVALDYAVSSSTTVTANFGSTLACQQQIDDVVIKATSCTQMSNYAEYSGVISISHATNPGNPVLKIDNGTLYVDGVRKSIATPALTSSPLYVANVKNLGNAQLGYNYSFDISGSELTTSGQGILAKVLKFLLIDVEIKKITLGSDEVLIEGRLDLPNAILSRLHKKTGDIPIDIGISSMMLSQSKGFYPGGVSLTVDELEIKGTPVSLSDVKINMDGIKEEIEIEGTVTIERLVSPTPGMAGHEFTGRLTLAKGGLQGFAISADSLNIPLGASPFYLQQIGGSVDGFLYDPVIISLKTSFSGGPKLNLGDWVGNYQTLCFNDVGVEIDPNSYFKHSGGAGILCFDSWEQAKNGAIAARLEGEYNWKTSSFKEKGTLTFPYEVLKGTGTLSITKTDFSGSLVGSFCAPKGMWLVGGKCFDDTSYVVNKKGVGGNINIFFKRDLAFFVDWGIGKSSWSTFIDHIQIQNLNELTKNVKKSAAKTVGKSVALPVADTITVPTGLDFAIIRVTWQTGTSDLTLIAPDGTVINSAYATAHPDTVMYTKLDNEAWYALENPAAGAWQADLTNLDTLGTVTVSVNTLNTPPTVAITSPATKVTSSTTVDISYSATDPDSTPTISLYYDTDSSGGAGAKIVEGLPMPSGAGTYSWDVSAVPAGVYYLFAIVDDGVNTPVIKYAAGTVEVVTVGAPAAPANLTAQANGTAMDLTWSLVSGATGYRVYYTDVLGEETYPKNIVVPAASSSYSLANLKPSTTYRATVTAFDATGAESRAATPVTITTAAIPVPIVTVSKDTLDFESVPLGQSKTISLTISNAGNADMTLSKADLLGTLSSSCAVSGVILPVTITSGSSVTVDITFTPLSGGTLNSTLKLSSNDPGTPEKSVALVASVPFLSYTVTPVFGTGGSMNPAVPQTVTVNSTTSFTITPSTGYAILSVSGCGGTLAGTTFTTGAISSACDVTATFSAIPPTTYTATPTPGTGSSITPATAQTVNSGATTSFTVAPVAGYAILSVSGCNGTLSGTTYTTGAMAGNCAVAVTAVKKNANSGSAADPTIADALKALQTYCGVIQLTPEETIRYDVAPLAVNGVPQGNGVVDVADVIMILRRSVGIGSW